MSKLSTYLKLIAWFPWSKKYSLLNYLKIESWMGFRLFSHTFLKVEIWYSLKDIGTQTTDAQWSLFSLKSRTFGSGSTIWVDKFWGIWGIFSQTISTHFCTVSPLSMLSIVHYFYKKLSLYIHTPNIYLGLELELEFGLQMIKDLAFVCP